MTDASRAPAAPAVDHGRRAELGRRAGVFALVALVTRLPGLLASRTFNPDEATLATGAQALVRGQQLYVDVIDRKPPLPFALYDAVFRITGTSDLRWVRLVVLMLVVLTALVVADEAHRRWGGRAGWVAGVVLVLGAAALGPADAPPANFEVIALLAIAAAVVAAARGGSRPAVLSGVALAVAVLCKQPAAVTAIPVAWSLWRTGRWRSLALGAVSGALSFLLLAWPFGVGKVLSWAVFGTGGYLSLSAGELGVAAVRVLALVALALIFWGGAWLLVLGSTSVLIDRGPSEPVGRSGDDLDVWLLLGVSVGGVVAGFRFFPHYLIQLLPAVALLAGRGAARRPTWLRPALAWGAASTVLAVVLAGQVAVTDPPRYETDIAAYVRRTTAADSSLLVWGNVPELYWRSDRVPAGGFTHTEFITGYSGGRRHEAATQATVPDPELYRDWVTQVRADRPAVIVDTSAAGIRGGDDFRLADFPAVARLVRTSYRRAGTIDGVPVYRRRGGGT